MWQVYGMVALNLINERLRQAEADRQGRRVRQRNPDEDADSRLRSGQSLRRRLLSTHRA